MDKLTEDRRKSKKQIDDEKLTADTWIDTKNVIDQLYRDLQFSKRPRTHP